MKNIPSIDDFLNEAENGNISIQTQTIVQTVNEDRGSMAQQARDIVGKIQVLRSELIQSLNGNSRTKGMDLIDRASSALNELERWLDK